MQGERRRTCNWDIKWFRCSIACEKAQKRKLDPVRTDSDKSVNKWLFLGVVITKWRKPKDSKDNKQKLNS